MIRVGQPRRQSDTRCFFLNGFLPRRNVIDRPYHERLDAAEYPAEETHGYRERRTEKQRGG